MLGFEEVVVEPCDCCPIALDEGDECICKVEQVIETNDEPIKYFAKASCSDYNCSRCH